MSHRLGLGLGGRRGVLAVLAVLAVGGEPCCVWRRPRQNIDALQFDHQHFDGLCLHGSHPSAS